MTSFISIAYAASDTPGASEAYRLVGKINDVIIFPLIALLMALAFLYFLYGAFEYVKNAQDESARETGRMHLMYGVIGMLVMLSAYAILNIAAGTFGLQNELQKAKENTSVSDSVFAPTSSPRPVRRPISGGSSGGATVPSVQDTDGPQNPPDVVSGSSSGDEPARGTSDQIDGLSLITAELIASGWEPENAVAYGKAFTYGTTRQEDYDALTALVNDGTISERSRDQFLLEKFGIQ